MIDVKELSKSYKVSRRTVGIGAAMKQFLSPTYDTVKAIQNLSFHINPGEIVGYMGPNGAGKSTTIKVMSGILTPDSGHCLIDGRVPWTDRKRHVAQIGVVFGQRSQLWWDTPVIDSFYLLKEIYKIPEASFKKTFSLLVETLNLNNLLETPVRQLSLGQRMRCEVAASLIHEPKILFLDEPTIGLDAVSKLAIRDFIQSINKEKNVTVILTTHDTSDLEALCKRVLLIGKGEILYDGDFESLKNDISPERYIDIKMASSSENFEVEKLFSYELLEGHKTIELLHNEKNELRLKFDPRKTSVSTLLKGISDQVEILDLEVSSAPVDEMIARLYKVHQL